MTFADFEPHLANLELADKSLCGENSMRECARCGSSLFNKAQVTMSKGKFQTKEFCSFKCFRSAVSEAESATNVAREDNCGSPGLPDPAKVKALPKKLSGGNVFLKLFRPRSLLSRCGSRSCLSGHAKDKTQKG
eukprot:CAMPEP_0196657774 /NCGR_PEP_ID=MMETSP1086-20130531/25471_1 /TAXON_ID=77921 /ORGANISM="Cyanoptyche  gloeocystis , Strain SAG4.97" /LENGTH=133 /DNA_ID=CAMNT_0041991043 /DNA_START=207 /DNA_END=608 /DNA_ORIENTATION=+